MSNPKFFCWHDDIRIVYGACRAALYDFKTGSVYSLDEAARNVCEQVAKNCPIQTIEAGGQLFLEQLACQQFGYFDDTPQIQRDGLPEIPTTMSLNFLWLELTDACNLRCMHCYADAGLHKSGGCSSGTPGKSQNITLLDDSAEYIPDTNCAQPMEVENWIAVLQQAAQLGCRQIQFIGGEPLLYPALFRLIDAAVAAKYEHIEVFTNGTLLTEENIKAFAEQKVRVAVSLHGSTSAIQDLIAQKAGSFDKVLTGLELLQRYRIPTRIATTGLEQNQDDLQAIEELVHKYGISYVNYDVVRPTGRGKDHRLLPTKSEAYERKWLSKPEFVTSKESYNRNKWWHTCWAGRLAVTKSGDVIPCVFGREQVVGNVMSDPLETILAGERLQTMWRITKDQIDICRDCEYRYTCDDCRPAALGETGDLYSKYPRCTYDPYLGEWQSVEEYLGLNDFTNIEIFVDRCNSATTDKYEPIPQLTLVTDQNISPEARLLLYSCDPK